MEDSSLNTRQHLAEASALLRRINAFSPRRTGQPPLTIRSDLPDLRYQESSQDERETEHGPPKRWSTGGRPKTIGNTRHLATREESNNELRKVESPIRCTTKIGRSNMRRRGLPSALMSIAHTTEEWEQLPFFKTGAKRTSPTSSQDATQHLQLQYQRSPSPTEDTGMRGGSAEMRNLTPGSNGKWEQLEAAGTIGQERTTQQENGEKPPTDPDWTTSTGRCELQVRSYGKDEKTRAEIALCDTYSTLLGHWEELSDQTNHFQTMLSETTWRTMGEEKISSIRMLSRNAEGINVHGNKKGNNVENGVHSDNAPTDQGRSHPIQPPRLHYGPTNMGNSSGGRNGSPSSHRSMEKMENNQRKPGSTHQYTHNRPKKPGRTTSEPFDAIRTANRRKHIGNKSNKKELEEAHEKIEQLTESAKGGDEQTRTVANLQQQLEDARTETTDKVTQELIEFTKQLAAQIVTTMDVLRQMLEKLSGNGPNKKNQCGCPQNGKEPDKFNGTNPEKFLAWFTRVENYVGEQLHRIATAKDVRVIMFSLLEENTLEYAIESCPTGNADPNTMADGEEAAKKGEYEAITQWLMEAFSDTLMTQKMVAEWEKCYQNDKQFQVWIFEYERIVKRAGIVAPRNEPSQVGACHDLWRRLKKPLKEHITIKELKDHGTYAQLKQKCLIMDGYLPKGEAYRGARDRRREATQTITTERTETIDKYSPVQLEKLKEKAKNAGKAEERRIRMAARVDGNAYHIDIEGVEVLIDCGTTCSLCSPEMVKKLRLRTNQQTVDMKTISEK
ncbi:hypothetical protein BDD12DRAFT_904683 [Trichophaea hybrida]|nr:hypothetical protein BDD12DRAFT_904683 [Trichophaea hybrida]